MATIGGILLIIASWFVLKGKIFISVLIYFLADLCWLGIAYSTGDVFGTVSVGIGMTLGLIAFLKMHFGKMRKTLEN